MKTAWDRRTRVTDCFAGSCRSQRARRLRGTGRRKAHANSGRFGDSELKYARGAVRRGAAPYDGVD